MNTEEVLEMIDNSIRDTEVSDDAMRWAPDGGPEKVQEHNVRRLRTVPRVIPPLVEEVFRMAREEVARNGGRGFSAPHILFDEVPPINWSWLTMVDSQDSRIDAT